MSEVDLRAPKGLPEPLPEGERILWQRSPLWWPFARRVFQCNRIAFYFVLLLVWVAGSAYVGSGEFAAVLVSLSWSVPPALAVFGMLLLFGWLYARTTIYTVTSKRIVIQSGLAFPAMVNLPFARIESADLKTFADGSGDIELTLSGPRALYSMLWPNVRLLRIGRPRPMMRGIPEPRQAAEILGDALAREEPREAAPVAPPPIMATSNEAEPRASKLRCMIELKPALLGAYLR
ncbi:MAG: photosynthetic complex putative assembly protein PuhB, partial [Wenzhouxiangellaceae bacterium]